MVQDGVLAFLGIGTLVLVALAVCFPEQLEVRLHGGPPPSVATIPRPAPSASALAPAPTPPAAISPEPAAVVLRLTDLPDGYRVLKAGPPVFNTASGGSPPDGWDVVFAPDGGRRTEYLLVESAVAVYADVATAEAALEGENAAERATHAVQLPPVPGLASRQAVWIEPAPDRPGYGIVRITWQELNVVGQVGTLGPTGWSEPQQTGALAMVEQRRINTTN
jgi:hypothetical protein